MDKEITDQAYAYCQKVCKDASSTFFTSFSALENQKRNAVHSVYALCRWVDDIVDGDDEPNVIETEELLQQSLARDEILRDIHSEREIASSPEVHMQRLMALVSIRKNLKRASEGKITASDQQIFIALQDVFSRYPIRLQDFETVIEGMEDDLFTVQCNDWDELRAYCYKVASAVGLILIEIYGYEDKAARLHAIDLGIQMQMINVLRDVSEDFERGRVYLPKDVLASHNIDVEDLAKPNLAKNKSWNAFTWEYIEIVRRHQSSALHLFEYLDARSRVQPKIMLDAYTKLFDEIIRRAGDVFTAPLKLTLLSKISLWVKIKYMKLKVRMSTNN